MGVEYSNERLTLHIVRCWGWGLALFGFQVWYAWMVLPEFDIEAKPRMDFGIYCRV